MWLWSGFVSVSHTTGVDGLSTVDRVLCKALLAGPGVE